MLAMISRLALLLALAAAPAVVVSPVVAAPAQKAPEAGKRHPLKGVVVAVDASLSALRVKHEEIPGVMRAMTMLFKVDDATLKTVKAGDEIAALMTRENGEWRLYEIKVTKPAKK